MAQATLRLLDTREHWNQKDFGGALLMPEAGDGVETGGSPCRNDTCDPIPCLRELTDFHDPIRCVVGKRGQEDPVGDAVDRRHGADTEGERYLLDLESGIERRLTEDPHLDLRPRFSPDGVRILFTTGRDGTFDQWVYDLGRGSAEAVIADGEPIRSRDDAAFFVDWIEDTLSDLRGRSIGGRA